jgi:glycosyltransferase involved in cell wall biosynthesis
MNQYPFVSIVVPFYNAKNFLPRLLEDLLNQNYPKEKFEVILVDDGSTDDSSKEILKIISNKSKFYNIKIIRLDKRGGPARARNFGIKNSNGEIIAFTDADTIPSKSWLKELVKGFTDNSIGGVAGRVETDFEKLLFPIRISPVAEYVTCNIAYRKDVLLQVGLFDENFIYPFREDSDLAYRVLDKGYKIVYQDSAIVYHPLKQLKLKDFIRIIKYHSYDVLLFKKHPLRSRSLLAVRFYRFTTAGIVVIFNAALIILLFLTIPIMLAIFLIPLYFSLGTLIFMLLKKSSKSVGLKERFKAAMWHELYMVCTVLGHIIGSIKFKIFLL